jgi:fructose-bisphosphate aldolase class I
MDGSHDIDECYEVTEAAQRALFEQLYVHGVLLEGTILKPSMVISGSECAERAAVEDVAEATLQCLLNAVPASLAGVVFLSGGQSDVEATHHLSTMNRLVEHTPWPLSFSYGRALQQAALSVWGADPAKNWEEAQRILAHRARMNGLAAMGQYETRMEE